jgi:predicted ArsR family transcriptional regulator
MQVSAAQLAALASSVRLAVVQRLDMEGTATARELADFLGQPVTGLYHHLKLLQEKRLIRVGEFRQAGARDEAVYALVNRRISSARAVRTSAGRKSLLQLAARVMAATLRAFSASLSTAAARLEGRDRNTAIRHLVFRANRERLAGINATIDELCHAAGLSDHGGEALLLTIVLAPLERAEQE